MEWHSKGIRRYLPSVRFLTVHYFYFISVCLLTSVILWAASTPPHSVRYIDALFLTVSAMTLAGLNTVDLSTLNTFQQIILFVLIMLGSAVGYCGLSLMFRARCYRRSSSSSARICAVCQDGVVGRFRWTFPLRIHPFPTVSADSYPQIWVSIAVLLVRRRAFAKRFSDVIEEERLRNKGALTSISLGRGISRPRSSARFDDPASSQQPESSPKWRSSRYRAGSNAETGRRSYEGEYSFLPDFARASTERDSVRPRTKETAVTGRVETPRNSYQSGGHASSPNSANPENHVAFAPDTSPLSRLRSGSFQQQRLRSAYTNIRAQVAAEVEETEEKSYTSGAADGHIHFPRKIGRNSTFHHLTEAERLKLGGVEYRAVSLLTLIVPIYFFLWQILGGLGIGAYIARNRASTTEENGLNPWYASSNVGGCMNTPCSL